MYKLSTTFCACIIAFLPFVTDASNPNNTSQALLKSKMLEDIDVIKNTFEVKYAPVEWKKKFAGWDLNEQINIIKKKVRVKPSITIKDYQRILQEFFHSTKDYHVGALFHSTAVAFIPIQIRGAEGRYFVTWIDPELKSGIAVGDEVLYINGQSVENAIAEIKANELGNPESLTDQGFAEFFLSIRVGAIGHHVPTGSVEYIVLHPNSSTPETYNLSWQTTPEEISAGPYNPALKSMAVASSVNQTKKSKQEKLSEHSYFKKEMVTGLYEPIRAAYAAKAKLKKKTKAHDENNEDDKEVFLGAKKGYLPNLGKVIWEAPAENPFRAYLFLTPSQKTIGYIRIGSYMEDGDTAKEFAHIMQRFNAESDALVIDQLNNPGGIVFYMYSLASMLSPTPLYVPSQRMTITQEEVHFALTVLDLLSQKNDNEEDGQTLAEGEEIFGYPISEEFIEGLRQHFHYIIAEWNAGRTFTNPAYFYGIEALQPHPWGHYNKPILLLVNSMDFSCGDFLPAILQDNKRATIMGTKTAGAGGFLLQHQHPNRFGVSLFHFTGSLAERLDKNPIENLGVSPDIYYDFSAKDLRENYVEYIEKIYEVLETMSQVSKAPPRMVPPER